MVLGIDGIEATKRDYSLCSERLNKYVDEWLRGNAKSEPTWKSLCNALKDTLVGEVALAEGIAVERGI
jgi:hypothetical protein